MAKFDSEIFSKAENVVVESGMIAADVSLCTKTLMSAVRKSMKMHNLMFTNANSIPFFTEAFGSAISESMNKPKTVDDHFEFVRAEIAKLAKAGEIAISCDLSAAKILFEKIVRILREKAQPPHINWDSIPDVAFNIKDPYCGWWTNDGFADSQHAAKDYRKSDLTVEERIAINKHKCSIWSA